MLSKKMAVSLMSLITIFALAFGVTPAMAGEFGVSLLGVEKAASGNTLKSLTPDVSYDDNLQVDRAKALLLSTKDPPDPPVLTVRVKFDKAVVLAKTNLTIGSYDADGNFLPATTVKSVALPASPNTATTAASTEFSISVTSDATVAKVTLKIAKGIASADPFDDDTSKELRVDIALLDENPNTAPALGPDVLKIAMVSEPFGPVTTAEFQTYILLSEEPKEGLVESLIELSALDFGSLVKLASPRSTMTIGDAGIVSRPGTALTATHALTTLASWRDGNVHLYRLTVKTKAGERTAKIRIKNFLGKETPTGVQTQERYVRKADKDLVEGRDILTVKTKTVDRTIKAAGFAVVLDKEKRIPANGYLVVATNITASGIKVSARPPAHLLYNVIEKGLPNLETFLANGGTIDLVAPAGIYISEVMWGSDASLSPNNNSQWIEIANTRTSSVLTGDKTHQLIFYRPNERLPAASTVADRIGTVGAGGYWSIAGIGQPGRTGMGKKATDVVAVVPTQALISMQRVMNADGTPADGTLSSGWVASVPPALNFDVANVGVRIGTPGAAPVASPVAPTPPTKPDSEPVIPPTVADDIKITEIMVDPAGGRLPQWIELTNVSGKEVSLAGWSVEIENAAEDTDVRDSEVSIDLSGTLGVGNGTGVGGTMGKTLLLVAWKGRHSSNLDESKTAGRILDVSKEIDERRRYKLISDMAFNITLLPPQTTGIVQYGDMAGNLDAAAAWDLPMENPGRSSLIRRERLADGTKTKGTNANGWILASSTSLNKGPATWYGLNDDAGTPGYDAGGPLPVELSHFRPARDKATGQVVITWATQAELNNAGFFIKRSQQRNGEFKVINATMIAGAGTTSEKQFYTYTDTIAQPNVVYYYQIEDVSLDGNRQTLTRGIRLKGHIGAAGKLTSTWGELKSSNE